jgi:hypothetical protein
MGRTHMLGSHRAARWFEKNRPCRLPDVAGVSTGKESCSTGFPTGSTSNRIKPTGKGRQASAAKTSTGMMPSQGSGTLMPNTTKQLGETLDPHQPPVAAHAESGARRRSPRDQHGGSSPARMSRAGAAP